MTRLDPTDDNVGFVTKSTQQGDKGYTHLQAVPTLFLKKDTVPLNQKDQTTDRQTQCILNLSSEKSNRSVVLCIKLIKCQQKKIINDPVITKRFSNYLWNLKRYHLEINFFTNFIALAQCLYTAPALANDCIQGGHKETSPPILADQQRPRI